MSSEDNIIKAIPNYNSNNIEENILNLKRELKEQKNINNALKETNYVQKAIEVTNFIDRNSGQINDQLIRLQSIVNELKTIHG